MNGLDLGGFRLLVELLSNQAEPVKNLFEQVCATTTTTVTSLNKNDPRLANATAMQPAQASVMTLPAESSVPPTTTSANTSNKEERESISNAVASLPPAQVCYLSNYRFSFIVSSLIRCSN